MRVGAVSAQEVCGSIIPPVIEKQFTHVALGCLPFVSQHLLPDVQLLTAPTARRDVVLTDKA